MLLRSSSVPLLRTPPKATRFALHWDTAIRCRLFCRHRLNSHLTTPHRRIPVSGRVSRPDLVPVSFSSFTFLREEITLQHSQQDGVAGTVTQHLSENLRKSLKRLQSLRNNHTWFTECLPLYVLNLTDLKEYYYLTLV